MVRSMHPSTPKTDAFDDLVAAARPHYDTAQELVLNVTRRAVLEGVLAPGVRVRQEELAKAFATSRIPVREALRVLEYEGLVTSEPHRGFTVTSLDAEQIDEIYDLRIVLESHAVRLAIPLMTEVDERELTALYDEMAKADDPDEQLAGRERLYLRLYSITARPRLVGLIVRLRQDVARSLRWKLVQHSPSHHEIFFNAIMHGEADVAVGELTSHYRKISSLLRRFIKEAASGGEPNW